LAGTVPFVPDEVWLVGDDRDDDEFDEFVLLTVARVDCDGDGFCDVAC
jgi:hypothetical protein